MSGKLFYTQPEVTTFSAVIVTVTPVDANHAGIILEQTAFYPEGGGQPCDTGSINSLPVVDVQERDGHILHIIEGQADQFHAGDCVVGLVDWMRRLDHMQQHSGQHILSAVLHRTFQAVTVGFHLGSETSQLDIALEEFTPAMADQTEQLANEAVFADWPIETKWLQPEELTAYPVRKIPQKQFDSVRLVYIRDFDYSLCCGTHAARTGVVGLIKIRHWERKNNAIRLDFVCGGRALRDYQQKHALLGRLTRRFSAPVTLLEESVSQILDKNDLLSKELLQVRMSLYKELAERLAANAERIGGQAKVVVYILENAVPQDVVMLSKELRRYPGVVALLAAVNADRTHAHVLFSASAEADDVHMGNLLQSVLPALDGKGGGSATVAQGGCANVAGLAAALTHVQEQLQAAD